MTVKELQHILMNMLYNKEITLETDIGIYLSIPSGSYERDSDCLYFENMG